MPGSSKKQGKGRTITLIVKKITTLVEVRINILYRYKLSTCNRYITYKMQPRLYFSTGYIRYSVYIRRYHRVQIGVCEVIMQLSGCIHSCKKLLVYTTIFFASVQFVHKFVCRNYSRFILGLHFFNTTYSTAFNYGCKVCIMLNYGFHSRRTTKI